MVSEAKHACASACSRLPPRGRAPWRQLPVSSVRTLLRQIWAIADSDSRPAPRLHPQDRTAAVSTWADSEDNTCAVAQLSLSQEVRCVSGRNIGCRAATCKLVEVCASVCIPESPGGTRAMSRSLCRHKCICLAAVLCVFVLRHRAVLDSVQRRLWLLVGVTIDAECKHISELDSLSCCTP